MKVQTGGQAVVDVLEREGIKKAFCVPGESYLDVMDGLYQHSTIQLISTRHEGGASFMAEAYAKTSGDVGVCMATRGPGAANLSIGLHTAMQDSTPLVALIGQVERSFKGKEAFQEIDFPAYFQHLCKWSVEIDDSKRVAELLHRAFYVARSGRPGPVVVSLPHDMLEEEAGYVEGTVLSYTSPEPDMDKVQEVLNKLQRADKPVIIAGGGVIASSSQESLTEFAEKLEIPVVSSFRRFNVMENDHPNYIGWLGLGTDTNLVQTIKKADVVIALGTRLSQITSQNYTLFNQKTELIQVDISESTIGVSFPVHTGVVADVKKFLNKALQGLSAVSTNQERKMFVAEERNNYFSFSTPPQTTSTASAYVDLGKMITDLEASVPSGSIITSDAGNFYAWLARYFRFTKDRRYIGPTSGAMGYGLPAAIGAKAAHPDKTVVSLSGDGGFMMTIQELETAVREHLPVVVIVINNNMYGTIRAHQESRFPDRRIATSLTNPNFAETAKLFGCDGEVVEEDDAFISAFTRALKSRDPYVIEVKTDPNLVSLNQALE